MIRPIILPMFYYDYNIWSIDKGSLTLTAYEREMYEGIIYTNSENYHSISFTAPEDIVEIEYLLGTMYVNEYPLTGYDNWEGLDYLTRPNTPDKIQQFLDTLPEYTIPKKETV
jgi:hypothetical protein